MLLIKAGGPRSTSREPYLQKSVGPDVRDNATQLLQPQVNISDDINWLTADEPCHKSVREHADFPTLSLR